MNKMANEEIHPGATVTTSHILDPKNSVSDERTRKCAPPTDSENSSRSSTCSVQCSKRSDACKQSGTVIIPEPSHKKDFLDTSSRHMQPRMHQGGTYSLPQQGHSLVSRRGSGLLEDGSSLKVDELFAAPNGTTSDVKGTEGRAGREMSDLSERNGNSMISSDEKAATAPSAAEGGSSGTRCERTASTTATCEDSGDSRRTVKTPLVANKFSEQASRNEQEAVPASLEDAAAQQKAHLEQRHEEGLQHKKIDDQQEAFQDEGCTTDFSDEAEKPLFPRYLLKALPSVPAEARLSDDDVRLLHQARHSDPFGVLGPHEVAIREPSYENKKLIVVR